MTSWTRARRVRMCGRCGELIPVGAPLYVMLLEHVSVPKLRCGICAGPPVPPDLPLMVEQAPVTIPQSWTRFTVKAVAPLFDVKLAQVGEREPGEDDG